MRSMPDVLRGCRIDRHRPGHHPPEQRPPDHRRPEQVAELRALLRQLAIGLSVFRLYAGESEVEAVQAALERIRAAAAEVLTGGALAVEVRSGRFVAGGDELAGDDVDRLARACFERRVEHLAFERPPDAAELTALFWALSTDPTDVEARGGVPAMLAARGVTAVVAGEDAPDPASGEELDEHVLALADWSEAVDDTPVEEALAIRLRPGEDGGSLYRRLRDVAATLPDEVAARSPFYRHAADLVAALPPGEQPAFARTVLTAIGTDPFAERYVGHLPDLQLAEMIVRVAEHEGVHPGPLAHDIARSCGRHANLARLALDLGTGAAEPPADGPATTVAPTPTHPLRTAFPDDDLTGRRLALTTLVDFLANDPRPDQLVQILDAMVDRLKEDLAAGDLPAIEDLLLTLEDAAVVADPTMSASLRRPALEALDAAVVAEALGRGASRAVSLLRPFGSSALPPLLTLLHPQHPVGTRRAAADALVTVGADRLDELATHHLGQHPAPVLAELAGVLSRIGGPQVMPLLSRLSFHRSPQVLAAVVDAVSIQDAALAAPLLAAICARTGDREVQRRCVEALGRHHLGSSRALLVDLSRRSSSPLPWRLRRRARSLSARPKGRP